MTFGRSFNYSMQRNTTTSRCLTQVIGYYSLRTSKHGISDKSDGWLQLTGHRHYATQTFYSQLLRKPAFARQREHKNLLALRQALKPIYVVAPGQRVADTCDAGRAENCDLITEIE